jgi:hypothetical protein
MHIGIELSFVCTLNSLHIFSLISIIHIITIKEEVLAENTYLSIKFGQIDFIDNLSKQSIQQTYRICSPSFTKYQEWAVVIIEDYGI